MHAMSGKAEARSDRANFAPVPPESILAKDVSILVLYTGELVL
jgi:hypothetical protein